jgi:hypothetical protein
VILTSGYLQKETVQKQGESCQNKNKAMVAMVTLPAIRDWEAKIES